MCSPSSSFPFSNSQGQQHRLRKGVPGGSEDFQKVLDTIICNDTDKQDHELEDEKDFRYEEDIDYSGHDSDERNCEDNLLKDDDNQLFPCVICSIDNTDDENNNSFSRNACKVQQCKKQDGNRLTKSPIPLSGKVSPSEINIFNCDGLLLYHCDGDDIPNECDASYVKFPLINQHHNHLKPSDCLVMGANCSSGLYDRREWNDIMGKDGLSETKVRKKGRPFYKKQLNLSSTKDSCVVVSSQLCTCKYRISDSSPDPVSEPIPIPGSNILRGDAAHDSEKRNCNSPKSGSPNIPDMSATNSQSSAPGQNRLSRMLGVKKTPSPSKNDTSPHRLLVRRSYSPKSRASSMEEMIRQNNDSIYRQRSQSWSNGKLGAKPTVNATSSPLIQSPILSPVANHTALVPSRLISPANSPKHGTEKQKDKTLPNLPQGQLVSSSAHDQSCPLFKVYQHRERDSPSPNDSPDDVDDNITPVTRRRAVSESQTLRSRQKARRAAAMSNGQDNDHLHVHWADEGEGSPLSTSVFLSSIRPRSYSQSAVGNVPHRPILKKVIIS